MGEILRDAVSATFTPSLNGPEKSALVQIATYADDYTGKILSASGDIRQFYIGLCEYLPEPTRQRPAGSRTQTSTATLVHLSEKVGSCGSARGTSTARLG